MGPALLVPAKGWSELFRLPNFNYEWFTWIIAVTLDTEINTDPRCSRTVNPDMVLGSNREP